MISFCPQRRTASTPLKLVPRCMNVHGAGAKVGPNIEQGQRWKDTEGQKETTQEAGLEGKKGEISGRERPLGTSQSTRQSASPRRSAFCFISLRF